MRRVFIFAARLLPKRFGKPEKIKPRKLLVIDTSFSYQAIHLRGLEDSVTCRDLRGYFIHVWSVHPFASLVSTFPVKKSGRPKLHQINTMHTFIDGKVGLFSWLEWFPKLNFLLSQLNILVYLCYLVKKQEISIIRVADPLYNGLIGFLISRLMGIPLLVRVGANHDKTYETTGLPMLPNLFPSRRIEKAVGQFILSQAECVACANLDNMSFAIANGARPSRTTLFRYGNLLNKLHFVSPDSRNKNSQWLSDHDVSSGGFLMYVGRLEPVKHPDDVLKAFKELSQLRHNLKLLIVGDGQMKAQLKDLSFQLNIANQVIFCGNQNQNFLASMYPLAAVVLSPHTGRALAEAALGGSKIVAYDIDWQGEIIESGVTGELVPHKDWMQMAEAADKILRNPSYARKISISVREHALLMLNPDLLDEHERNTYSTMLERSAQFMNSSEAK